MLVSKHAIKSGPAASHALNSTVVNQRSQCNGFTTGLLSVLQKLYFTANHTLREQMARSEVKPSSRSSKTKLTEAGGIICMKWPAHHRRKSLTLLYHYFLYWYFLRRLWEKSVHQVGQANMTDICFFVFFLHWYFNCSMTKFKPTYLPKISYF